MMPFHDIMYINTYCMLTASEWKNCMKYTAVHGILPRNFLWRNIDLSPNGEKVASIPCRPTFSNIPRHTYRARSHVPSLITSVQRLKVRSDGIKFDICVRAVLENSTAPKN